MVDELGLLKINFSAFVSQFEKVRETISNIYITINNMIFETHTHTHIYIYIYIYETEV